MEKQIEKALSIVKIPFIGKKIKFLPTTGQKVLHNYELIEKTKKLLGLKGYNTNLEEDIVSNQIIIKRYH